MFHHAVPFAAGFFGRHCMTSKTAAKETSVSLNWGDSKTWLHCTPERSELSVQWKQHNSCPTIYLCLKNASFLITKGYFVLFNCFFFLSGRLKWSSIYPQQPVTVGSSPDLFVICSFTTSSAHVGWTPTVADKVLYVRPHLEKTHTRNLWERQPKCGSTTFEDIAYGSHIF